MLKLRRTNGMFLAIVGIILIGVAFVVLNGLGGLGTGHTRADVFAVLGVVFILVGGYAALTRA